jgi:hypothetical protein
MDDADDGDGARYSLRSSSSSLRASITSQVSRPSALARFATSLGVPMPIFRAHAISRWLRPCCHFHRRMDSRSVGIALLSERLESTVLAVSPPDAHLGVKPARTL